MNRESLISALEKYATPFNEEASLPSRFLALLQHEDAFQRDHYIPGHITGSSWILDHSRQWVLLVHHGTLNKWLQPGGHADGEENVLQVALREANEETGLQEFELLQESIFDLDIHPIPQRLNFPGHLHFDIRFLFEADKNKKVIISDESHDVAWKRIDQLGKLTQDNPSILRMAIKSSNIKI